MAGASTAHATRATEATAEGPSTGAGADAPPAPVPAGSTPNDRGPPPVEGAAATAEAPPPPSSPPPPPFDAPPPAAPSREASPPAPPAATSPRAAPIDLRGTFGVGAYRDDVGVNVLTPSVAVTAKDALAGYTLSGSYLVDVVSAASPDVVSTATPAWSEVRHAGGARGSYKPGNYGVAGGVVTSYTPDYLSLGANLQVTGDFDEKNLSLSAGYGFGHDVIGRTGTSFSTFSRRLDGHTLSASLMRVVNPALVVTIATDFILERGDPSKPYRYIPIFSAADAPRVARGASAESVAALRLAARPLEQLPLGRERGAATGKVAWRLAWSTLRAEERLYADSWGLLASTTDVRWLVDTSARWMIWPHVRVHQQGGVDFWQRAYVGTATDVPALRTGDRELGPLTNVGLGGGLRVALGRDGTIEDKVLTITADGTYTSFADAIYVKERLSALVVATFEASF